VTTLAFSATIFAMKLSAYAKAKGVRYETAWRWFRDGQIKGRRFGRTIIVEEEENHEQRKRQRVAIYARVSSAENQSNLDSQAERLIAYCTAKGDQVAKVVKEVGSGVNDSRIRDQNFCQIPHARFIEMLTYKAELVGITVKLTEESYTSQASFLDRDWLPTYDPNRKQEPKFSGKRVKRGLYRASSTRYMNADLNGACNIIRKVAPKAFDAEGVEDGEAVLASLVVHPRRIVVLRPTQEEKSKACLERARKR
jgi:predicted site-specific integrase-resolvase